VTDPTEGIRRVEQAALNAEAAALAAESPDPRVELEARYARLWDTSQLQNDYSVVGFMAPYTVVVRKADGVKGTLMFSHSPRFYHSFSPA
jgi:hypothetical protein